MYMFQRISLYTMLDVIMESLVNFCWLFPSMATFTLLNELTLENATYNCPWENTGLGKQIPAFCTVWPWALFIVIAKAILMVNCFRLSENGIVGSDGVRTILGMIGINCICNNTVLV